MNSAADYAKLIVKLHPADSTAGKIWRRFLALAEEYDRVDWLGSEKLGRLHRAKPKRCFDNAFRIALKNASLKYCEGFACSIIPVEHAWLVDQDGSVIDPTWWRLQPRPQHYFGVVIQTASVLRARRENPWEPIWCQMIRSQLAVTP